MIKDGEAMGEEEGCRLQESRRGWMLDYSDTRKVTCCSEGLKEGGIVPSEGRILDVDVLDGVFGF